MDCSTCRVPVLRFPVSDNLQPYLPETSPGATICPTCLTLQPDDDPPAKLPDFAHEIGNGFPDNPEAGIRMAIALGLLNSLALYRSEISDLFEQIEKRGVDPMLVLDRLAASGSVESNIDLRGRKTQLEQLLE